MFEGLEEVSLATLRQKHKTGGGSLIETDDKACVKALLKQPFEEGFYAVDSAESNHRTAQVYYVLLQGGKRA